VGRLVPTCVWRASSALILALDGRFGPPHDAYVNGSQVWLRDDGPGGLTVEWRLHPVGAYQRPAGVDTYDVFEATAVAFATGTPPPAPLEQLWDGIEAFSAYDEEVEPATLAAACQGALGLPPDATGLVDHDRVADEWERSKRRISIVDALLAQLGASQ
jgi:hypothetical protein